MNKPMSFMCFCSLKFAAMHDCIFMFLYSVHHVNIARVIICAKDEQMMLRYLFLNGCLMFV